MEGIEEYIKKYSKGLKEVTLCYLIDRKNGKVLLAMKKRGFGEGKINGVGGKLEKNETVEQALIRETREEITVKLKDFEKVAVIEFYFKGNTADKNMNQRAYVFISYSWEGTPNETEEMAPLWVDIDKIPLDKMWEDDRYWLPDILKGKKIKAAFLFDENQRISEKIVEEIKNF
ncbi:MAG: 8-oxo-dGTP diphosphatase [Candidatus Parvarchaeum sp.]